MRSIPGEIVDGFNLVATNASFAIAVIGITATVVASAALHLASWRQKGH